MGLGIVAAPAVMRAALGKYAVAVALTVYYGFLHDACYPQGCILVKFQFHVIHLRKI